MIKSLSFNSFQAKFAPKGLKSEIASPHANDVTPLTPYKVEVAGHNSAPHITNPLLCFYEGAESEGVALGIAQRAPEIFNDFVTQTDAMNKLLEMLGGERVPAGEIQFAIRVTLGDKVIYETQDTEFTDYYTAEA